MSKLETAVEAHSSEAGRFARGGRKNWMPAYLYRYFDCTQEAEFVYSCVQRTVEQNVPREIDYLGCQDEAIRRIMDAVRYWTASLKIL
jgi:hypothetical protein